jgi:uncharacterized protein (DUF1015 family)
VLPHERTLDAPKEDRYRLLRATGVNTSPVVGLFEDRARRTERILGELTGTRPADVEVVDDDGTSHRLWVVPLAPAAGESDSAAAGPADSAGPADLARELLALAAESPITIADGHHRYETALRYRDERRMSRSCEEDPPFDYILALLLESTGQPLTILPTHRVIRGLGNDGVRRLRECLGELFEVEPADRDVLLAGFGRALAGGGRGRLGLWTRAGGAILTARRAAFAPWLPAAGAALRGLDVALLGVALDRLAGIDADAVAGGERVAYTKSAAEALDRVDAGTDGADAAFLLEPTPVEAVIAVSRDGDVMPQKSTYFYPKALTGLVINPHEW